MLVEASPLMQKKKSYEEIYSQAEYRNFGYTLSFICALGLVISQQQQATNCGNKLCSLRQYTGVDESWPSLNDKLVRALSLKLMQRENVLNFRACMHIEDSTLKMLHVHVHVHVCMQHFEGAIHVLILTVFQCF